MQPTKLKLQSIFEYFDVGGRIVQAGGLSRHSKVRAAPISLTRIAHSRNRRSGLFYRTSFLMVTYFHSFVRACFSMDERETWQPMRKEVKLATCVKEHVCFVWFSWYFFPKFGQSATRYLVEFWISFSQGKLNTFFLYCLKISILYVSYFLRTIAKHHPNPTAFGHSFK